MWHIICPILYGPYTELLLGPMSIWKSLLQTINHKILCLNENKLKRVTNGIGYRCTLDASQIIWVTEGWLFNNTESSLKYRSPSFYFRFNDTRVRCSERQPYSRYHQNLNFMSLIQFTRFEIFIRSTGEFVQLELNEVHGWKSALKYGIILWTHFSQKS